VRAKNAAWTPNQPVSDKAIDREMMTAPILPKDKLAIKGVEKPVFAPI
jgi:hypothetical protein